MVKKEAGGGEKRRSRSGKIRQREKIEN